MKKNKTNILIYIILLIFIFPRSFESIFPLVYELINVLKILSIFILMFIIFKNKIKLSKFSFWAIFYFFYIFLITIFNGLSIMTFVKTYVLNFGVLLLCEVIFASEENEHALSKISQIFLILLVINLGFMIFCKFNYGTYYYQSEFLYFLGQDNRFILYILPPLICLNYLYNQTSNAKYKKYLIATYFVSFLSLILVWSASAVVVLSGIIIGNIYISIFKKNVLSLKFLILMILLINIGLIFFRIQNIFSFIIVDVLHKSLHLSYRTNIWDFALNIFQNDIPSLIFGHGFFDITNTFVISAYNSYGIPVTIRPNHLHNIIMNSLFFGGIIGSLIYINMYRKIINQINQIKNNKYIYNFFTIILSAILILMIFDTFEFYALYYFILYLLFTLSLNVKNNQFSNNPSKDI